MAHKGKQCSRRSYLDPIKGIPGLLPGDIYVKLDTLQIKLTVLCLKVIPAIPNDKSIGLTTGNLIIAKPVQPKALACRDRDPMWQIRSADWLTTVRKSCKLQTIPSQHCRWEIDRFSTDTCEGSFRRISTPIAWPIPLRANTPTYTPCMLWAKGSQDQFPSFAYASARFFITFANRF